MEQIKNLGTIAVIVPVYNVGPYIRECLDSLLAQTYPYWVAYVVDDGSLDNCGKIVDEYASKDSRFRVFHKTNGGLGDARNYALQKIEQQFENEFFAVTFLDSDDFLDADAYQNLVSIMSETGVDVLSFDFRFLFPSRIQVRQKSPPSVGFLNKTDFCAAQISQNGWGGVQGSWGTVWNKLYRPDVIKGLRFEDTREIVEDEIFNLSVALRAESFYFFNRPYISYRKREGSFVGSSDFPIKQIRGRLKNCSLLEQAVLPEKDSILQYAYSALFEVFQRVRNNHINQFFEHIDFFRDIAKKLLPWGQQRYAKSEISEENLRFLTALSDKKTLLSLLMMNEVERLFAEQKETKNQLNLLRQKQQKETKQFQEERNKTKRLLKELEHGSKWNESRKKLKKFNIGRYLRTKILSKITFGSMRQRFKEQYRAQKKLYRMIKKGKF